MTLYTRERLAEERAYLMAMPGVNKRQDEATLKRLEQIERELKRSSKEGALGSAPFPPVGS